MNAEIILNVVWALAAVAGSAWLTCRPASGGRRVPFSHAVAVFLVVLCLFPAISASDDALRLELLHSRSARGDDSLGDPQRLHLAHLLDSLQEFRITPFFAMALALRCRVAVVVRQERCQDRSRPHASGRAPPCLA